MAGRCRTGAGLWRKALDASSKAGLASLPVNKPNPEREKRLAEALRANLRKRKEPRVDDQPPEPSPKR